MVPSKEDWVSTGKQPLMYELRVTSKKYKWGVKFEFLGLQHLLNVSCCKRPAVRIVVLGCSIHMGKIPETKTLFSHTGNNHAKSSA